MKSKIPHLKYYFVGIFAALSLAVTGWQLLYEFPRKKCEAAGHWWSYKYRECAVPMSIVNITGRPITSESANSQ